MQVLQIIRKEFSRTSRLRHPRFGLLARDGRTANLMIALRDGGADVALCASNRCRLRMTWPRAGSRLQHPPFAIKGEDNDSYYSHIMARLDHKPQITMDDGADLVSVSPHQATAELANVIGGTEETTTGVIRLRAMAKEGMLKFPIIAVNDADTKHLFDNRYGTGQSTIDGIIRATNFLLAGSKSWSPATAGADAAWPRRAWAGAEVIVTEIDPTKALEAVRTASA